MNSSLEDKRREIFELHQSWLRPDTALMRKSAPSQQTPIQKEKTTEKSTVYNKSWMVKVAVGLAIIFILAELVFFAYELDLFK